MNFRCANAMNSRCIAAWALVVVCAACTAPVTEPEERPIERLDLASGEENSLQDQAADAWPISCMKIDAQGSELNIFRGACRMLGSQSVDMIMFEWFAVQHYENCPLLLDLWTELHSHGYSMFDLFPGRYFRNGQRRFGDAVFVSDKFRRDRMPHL